MKSTDRNEEEKMELNKDLEIIRDLIEKKKDQSGTKIQMKPGFKKSKKEKKKDKGETDVVEGGEEEKKEKKKDKEGKEDDGIQEGELEKMQLILKWGGEVSSNSKSLVRIVCLSRRSEH